MEMINISVKRKRPNELFELWLEEWKEKAKLKKSNLEEHFAKALQSLKKYPLPLKNGQECLLLQHFGSKLCTMLDKKLEQHLLQESIVNKQELDNAQSEDQFSLAINKPNVKKKTQSKVKKVNNIENTEDIDTNTIELISMNAFDIILLVDNKETSISSALQNSRTNSVVPFEVRHLNVGDFSWIARCQTTKKELVLPYIVERKRMDDLAASIKDRRYHEQKFRLKQSGIDNIIYLIEGTNTRTSMPISVLYQAAINSLIQDEFAVKFTDNVNDSAKYLSGFTMILSELYQGKLLIQSLKENLTRSSVKSKTVHLMSFNEFNQSSSKIRVYTVKEMFIKQLIQLKGLSLEAVMEIVQLYPTPFLLGNALLDAGPDGEKLLASVTYGPLKRKIGPALAKTIFQLYTNDHLE